MAGLRTGDLNPLSLCSCQAYPGHGPYPGQRTIYRAKRLISGRVTPNVHMAEVLSTGQKNIDPLFSCSEKGSLDPQTIGLRSSQGERFCRMQGYAHILGLIAVYATRNELPVLSLFTAAFSRSLGA